MTKADQERAGDRWAEALAWYTMLRAADEKELTSKVAGAWQDWYANPENRRTFDDVSRLMADRDLYKEWRRPSKAEIEQDDYDTSVPIAEWLSSHQPDEVVQQRSPASKWRWVSGGLAIAATLVLVILAPRLLTIVRGHAAPTAYQTGVGGLKEVHLADGSTITLGGQTKLLVAFSAQRRSVNLVQGQAWFKVVHDTHRPFIVAAGDGTIEDVGTAFLVTRESDRVIVTVTEGMVEVSPKSSVISPTVKPAFATKPVPTPIRVSRGEELAFSDNGRFDDIMPADTRAATTWTQGRLTFDNQPLRYVIETVDRYSSRQIVASPQAGTLRFSGIVLDNDIDDWLQSLEAIFPVRIQEHGPMVRIEMRSRKPVGGPLP